VFIIEINEKLQRQKNCAPWSVFQTLPIFVAREVVDSDKFWFTELQLEQVLGDDERDIGRALHFRFIVVLSLDCLPDSFPFGRTRYIPSNLCDLQ
jgi:hypothetical protein